MNKTYDSIQQRLRRLTKEIDDVLLTSHCEHPQRSLFNSASFGVDVLEVDNSQDTESHQTIQSNLPSVRFGSKNFNLEKKDGGVPSTCNVNAEKIDEELRLVLRKERLEEERLLARLRLQREELEKEINSTLSADKNEIHIKRSPLKNSNQDKHGITNTSHRSLEISKPVGVPCSFGMFEERSQPIPIMISPSDDGPSVGANLFFYGSSQAIETVAIEPTSEGIGSLFVSLQKGLTLVLPFAQIRGCPSLVASVATGVNGRRLLYRQGCRSFCYQSRAAHLRVYAFWSDDDTSDLMCVWQFLNRHHACRVIQNLSGLSKGRILWMFLVSLLYTSPKGASMLYDARYALRSQRLHAALALDEGEQKRRRLKEMAYERYENRVKGKLMYAVRSAKMK